MFDILIHISSLAAAWLLEKEYGDFAYELMKNQVSKSTWVLIVDLCMIAYILYIVRRGIEISQGRKALMEKSPKSAVWEIGTAKLVRFKNHESDHDGTYFKADQVDELHAEDITVQKNRRKDSE